MDRPRIDLPSVAALAFDYLDDRLALT